MRKGLWTSAIVVAAFLTFAALLPLMADEPDRLSPPAVTPTPTPAHVPFDPSGQAHTVPPVSSAPGVSFASALTRPVGIDLDVTYINRVPAYTSYCVEYPEPIANTVGIPRPCPGTEGEKRWPAPGEVVTFTAHIVNKGTLPSGPFDYTWFIDGSEVLSGTHPGLASDAEGTVAYSWPWGHAMGGDRVLDDHTVRCTVDPQEVIAETYEANNSLEDRTNALSLMIALTPEMVQAYNVPVSPTLSFSAEDWLQKQVAAMNQALARSVYPVTPQGATERVRLDAIVVASQMPDDGLAHDGAWFLADDVRDPAISYYTYEEDIDWGLVHELSHQIGLIDLYTSPIDAVSVRVLDRKGQPANFAFDWPRGGLMFGGDTAPHNDSHIYSSHSAGGISSSKGYRDNYYGAYQYDIPEQNYLQVLDNQGNLADGVEVALYQRNSPLNWVGLPEIDDVAEISGTTGTDGRLLLTNRYAYGGVTTPVGHTLRDNPFGLVDIVGPQNRFLIKLTKGQHQEFHWLDITQFNLAYWMGDTVSHTFVLSSHVAAAGAPLAPEMGTIRIEGGQVALAWAPSPSPGVIGYRVYRATPPEYRYLQAGGLVAGTSFQEHMTDGVTWDGHAVYAVTAVDGSGLESGFDSLTYAPSLHGPQDVAISAQGTRLVLDPWNPYSLYRQRSDGRYNHRLAAPYHGLSNARALAIDGAGRLLISDPGDAWSERHAVRVFDPDGRPLFAFGGPGVGPGQFLTPTGVVAWGQEPRTFGGPYAPDAHTLLLLHLDESYDGEAREPGTASGTGFAPGRHGPGVRIDGSDTLTYTTAGNVARTAGSIEFWVRMLEDGDIGQIHVLFETGAADSGIQIVKHGGGNLHFVTWTPTALTDIYAPAGDWRAGEWHHVAATWQGSLAALYVDGQARASSSDATPPEALGEVLYLGSSPRGDWQADAVIDELRISDLPRLGNSDTCGRIVVADSGNGRLQVFDSQGGFVSAYGSPGSGPGQFNDPQELAVDTQGRVVVADRGNGRLQVLGFDGTDLSFLKAIDAGLTSPVDVAAYGHYLVVADAGRDAVVVIGRQGGLVAEYREPNDGYVSPFFQLQGVAVERCGTIVVADSGNRRVATLHGKLPGCRTYLPLVTRE